MDDLLVYRKAADRYLLVVNAGNTPKDFAWARERVRGEVTVADRSSDYALIAVQGPKAAGLMARVAKPDPSDLPYYGFREGSVCGASALVSRTGYTGEDGFEVYLRPEDAERVFRALLDAGRVDGAVPCGLGARDTLRLEAKMALYGNDIDDTVTAYEADLGWIVKLDKGDFIGRDALVRAEAGGRSAQARRLRDGGPRHRPPRIPAPGPPPAPGSSRRGRTRRRSGSPSASRCFRRRPRRSGPNLGSTSAAARPPRGSCPRRSTRGVTKP